MTAAGTAASEAMAALALIEAAVDERYPEARLPHPLAGHPDAPAGLIIRSGEALTLIGVDIRGEAGGEWSLFVTTVLSVGGPDIDASLDWVNARNRHLGVGKYYSAYSRDAGVCAIAYDTWIQGAAFAVCLRPEPDEAIARLASVMIALVANVIDTGAAEAGAAAEATGGRTLGTGETDVQTLLVIALG
jgi:hypothetical protein